MNSQMWIHLKNESLQFIVGKHKKFKFMGKINYIKTVYCGMEYTTLVGTLRFTERQRDGNVLRQRVN